MKRLFQRVLSASVVLGLFVATACAHDDSSLFIRSVQAPDSCTYKNDPTQLSLLGGTVDAAFLASYRPVVLVGNQLLAQQKNESFRTETSRISLEGATVTLTDTQGAELTSFTSLTSGFVDPGSGSSPGWGLASVTLIDPKTIDALRTQIPKGGTKKLVAHFKVFGHTLGGNSIESNEAQFPIDVCYGCLVFRPADALCSQLADVGSVKAPCVAGQDEPIDCRLCYPRDVCTN